jgi:hypothetical protein
MPTRYILVCTHDRAHRQVIELDAWVWSTTSSSRYIMPEDALDELPDAHRLARFRCEECGASVLPVEAGNSQHQEPKTKGENQ